MDRVNQHKNHLLGNNIKNIQLDKGLRNRDVIAQLQLKGVDISSSTYSKILLGLNNPSVDFLIAIVDVFNCDFNTLFKQDFKKQ